MPSLEEMEREARDFGGTRTWTAGQHVIQIVSTRDPYSGNNDIQYRIGGWPVPRTHVVRALAGVPPEHRQTYQEMLESRVNGGVRVGPVVGG
jgi:hypothetical protein